MPSKNVIKHYEEGGYYHVYNRGVEKRLIFQDENDYIFFLGLLKRYLGKEKQPSKRGGFHATYFGDLELLAFCLMPNHFHLLFYINRDNTSVTELMRGVSGSYASFFNRKYQRVGPLFQGIYKASRISSDSYLHHISRYIHLNPKDFKNWVFSSYPYYIGKFQADWIKPGRVLELFDGNLEAYTLFLNDYIGQKEILDELKNELANS